jgi:hypothetical protein
MSEDNETHTTIEQPTIAPPSTDALAILADILRLVVDNKKSSERIRSLQQREAAALRAEANLGPAKVQHDAAISKERTELDKYKTRLDALADDLGNKAARLDEQHAQLADFAKELTAQENRLKRRMLTLANEPLWNETLQSAPSWAEVDRLLNPVDPHVPATGDGAVFLEDPGDGPSEAIPDAAAALTITRSPRQSAATRRAQREAAGLR